MKYLLNMFSDDKRNPSSMRFMSAYVIINTMVMWSWTIIKIGMWVDPTWNMLALIFGALGLKTWQKKYERE